MRRSKEVVVLIGLLAAAIAFVLWYVIDRRSRPPAPTQPAAAHPVGPAAPAQPAPVRPVGPAAPAPEVAIQERKTIDFSTGRPVVKDDDANQAAIDAAVKDMQAALKEVSFDPPKKPASPPATATPAASSPAPEKKP